MAFPQLVTFQQAKDHLRMDHDVEDTKIAQIVDQASAIVLTYIWQRDPRTTYQSLPVIDADDPTVVIPAWWTWGYWPFASSVVPWWPSTRISYQQLPPYIANTWFAGSPSDPTTVPFDVQAATLLVVGSLSKYRDEGAPIGDPITPGVRSLLAMWRDPAMA